MSDFGIDDDWAADDEGNDFDTLAVGADLGDDNDVGDYENTVDAEESFDLNTLESETRDLLGSGSAGLGAGDEDSLLERDGDTDDHLAASASLGMWYVGVVLSCSLLVCTAPSNALLLISTPPPSLFLSLSLHASPPPSPPLPLAVSGCLSVAYYRRFFDVDTKDVGQRILLAFLPFKKTGEFLKVWRNAGGRKKPDLYGPAWITTTLIFLIGVTANISSWFATPSTAAWTYDFSVIPAAMSLIYGCALGFPAACWVTFRYYGMDLGLIEASCLYGYANAPYIAAALICSIPVETVRWIALLVAYGLCAYFLFHNLRNAAKEGAQVLPEKASGGGGEDDDSGDGPTDEQKLQFSLSGPALVCIAQLAYTVAIKFLFFSGGGGSALAPAASPTSATPSPPPSSPGGRLML